LKTLFLKEDVHRYPYLTKEQDSPLYYKLWEDIFFGHSYSYMFPEKYKVNAYDLEETLGEKSGEVHDSFFQFTDEASKHKNLKKHIDFPKNHHGKRLFIKSIYNLLALDWLQSRFRFIPVIIIRHPANTISSYLKLKFADGSRNIFSQGHLVEDYFESILPQIEQKTDEIEKMAAQIGGIYFVLEKQLKNHPDWILLRHEELCANPVRRFKRLYKQLGLTWSQKVKKFIGGTDQPGEGFKARRITSQEIDKYKRLLTEDQIHKIGDVYALFGNPFYREI
jgi:hypothetical protein